VFDLFSQSPGCTGTVWSGNKFFTANQSCIHLGGRSGAASKSLERSLPAVTPLSSHATYG
jgi:hypothetical protein